MVNAIRHHLKDLQESEVLKLYEVLWSWNVCAACKTGYSCTSTSCPSSRVSGLTHFLNHYYDTCNWLELALGEETRQVLEHGHESIFRVIRLLKKTGVHSKDLSYEPTLENTLGPRTTVENCRLVINAVVRVMTMIDCTSSSLATPHLLEQGQRTIVWDDKTSYVDFIRNIFPSSQLPSISPELDKSRGILYGKLSARKLIKHAGITLKPTSDISSHLAYDAKSNSVSVFHHTAFLKEQLRISRERDLDMSKYSEFGTLPRQMILEVLDSTQKVMFPLSEPRSRTLLRKFVITNSLDPDCLRIETTEIRANHELNIAYHYFGNQLLDLYEILRNPRPRKKYEKWLERRSGARYVMLATLAGIMFAIFLGILSLAVSIFQTYLTYQAWKHPVSSALS